MFSVIELTSWLAVFTVGRRDPVAEAEWRSHACRGRGAHRAGAAEVPLATGDALPPVEPLVTVTVKGPTATAAPEAVGWADDRKLKVTLDTPSLRRRNGALSRDAEGRVVVRLELPGIGLVVPSAASVLLKAVFSPMSRTSVTVSVDVVGPGAG